MGEFIIMLKMYIRPKYHEDGIYHVYNRGVAKLPIFLKDSDYFVFKQIMRYFLVGFPEPEGAELSFSLRRRAQNKPVSFAADPSGNGMFKGVLDLLAYCLMRNHFHFLVRICKVSDTLHLPVSEFIKRLGITYSRRFNHDNQRVGPIFQGRFKIKEVKTDELVIHTARYIHMNPTMAGLVKKPEDWKHSDLSEYFNFQSVMPDAMSKPLFVLEYFNRSPEAYRDFVETQLTEQDSQKIFGITLEEEP
ncbi:transposase [candidate division WWE3 bacterium]|nr:transposase [candidate division WWE3 bacterium]